MAAPQAAIEETDSGIRIRVYVQPKASRDQWQGLHNDEIKLAITAPPVDGKANAHVVKWIAKQCKVAKSKVVIEKGLTSRHKQIVIESPTILPEPLKALL